MTIYWQLLVVSLSLQLGIADCEEEQPKKIIKIPSLKRRSFHGEALGRAPVNTANIEYNDILFHDQWYMNEHTIDSKGVHYEPTMGILAAQNVEGWTGGKSVRVVVIGNDNVNIHHQDITLDLELLTMESKEGPAYQSRQMAQWMTNAAVGIIAMHKDNKIAGAGVLPECRIGYVRLSENSFSLRSKESIASFCHDLAINQYADIFVHVWQYPHYDPNHSLITFKSDEDEKKFNALPVTAGPSVNNMHQRRSLGIHVMGSGDNREDGVTCHNSAYAAQPSMFVVASVGFDGTRSYYSQSCSSIVATTYSTSRGKGYLHNVVTISPGLDGNHFHGIPGPKGTTAVSAAIAAGIIGLAVDNQRTHADTRYIHLTRREMLYLVVLAADPKPIMGDAESLWLLNGRGLLYSHEFGFGIMNAAAMIHLMNVWVPLPLPVVVTKDWANNTSAFDWKKARMAQQPVRKSGIASYFKRTKYTREVYFSDKHPVECGIDFKNVDDEFTVEQIIVTFTAHLQRRGSLVMYLISPSGTVSVILEGRPNEDDVGSYINFPVRSLHFFGEHLVGTWTLRIETLKGTNTIPNGSHLDTIESKSSYSYISALKIEAHCSEQIPTYDEELESQRFFDTSTRNTEDDLKALETIMKVRHNVLSNEKELSVPAADVKPDSDAKEVSVPAAEDKPASDAKEVSVPAAEVKPASDAKEVSVPAAEVKPASDAKEVSVPAAEVKPDSDAKEVSVPAAEVKPDSNAETAVTRDLPATTNEVSGDEIVPISTLAYNTLMEYGPDELKDELKRLNKGEPTADPDRVYAFPRDHLAPAKFLNIFQDLYGHLDKEIDLVRDHLQVMKEILASLGMSIDPNQANQLTRELAPPSEQRSRSLSQSKQNVEKSVSEAEPSAGNAEEPGKAAELEKVTEEAAESEKNHTEESSSSETAASSLPVSEPEKAPVKPDESDNELPEEKGENVAKSLRKQKKKNKLAKMRKLLPARNKVNIYM